MHTQSARVDTCGPSEGFPALRALTLLQMGQGDGSFLYLVPSSPFASRSSFFMCFGPKQRHCLWQRSSDSSIVPLRKRYTPELLTYTMPPVVLLHHVFTVEHLVTDFAGIQFLSVLLLVLGEVAVGGEKARADITLEGLVI